VVPAEALQVGQQGSYVYVVRNDGTVEPRVVTPGRTLAGKVVIDNGIAPGDTVVVDGQLRLFPGARIRSVDAGKLEGIKL
jgi:multidrug efflux system membrane fusion protein